MGGGEQQQETDNFWGTWQASPKPQARVFSIGPGFLGPGFLGIRFSGPGFLGISS